MSSRRAGFSLIEVLIATAVFSVAFLALIGLFPTTQRTSRQAQYQLLANHVGETQMEQTLYAPFDSIVSTSPQTQVLTTQTNGTQQVWSFTYQLTVTPNANGNANLKDVRCRVTWNDDRFRYLDLETLVWK